MTQKLDCAKYERYLADAARDLGAGGEWNVRHFSPAELEHVERVAASDPGFRKRWEDRLALGYYREKSRLADEVEEFFAEIPVADETSNTREQAA